MRYSLDSSTNRFLVINFEISDISNNTLIKARDAIYFENIFSFRNQVRNPIQYGLSSNPDLVELEVPCDSKKKKRSWTF